MTKPLIITKDECAKEIKKRDFVCTRCGRKLVPIKTFDNAGNPTYWSGCYHGLKEKSCGHFDYGREKEIYNLAVKLILDGEVIYDFIEKKNKEYWFREQVSGACKILSRIDYIKTNEPRFTKQSLLNYI